MENHPLSLKHVNKETGSSPMGVSFAPQKDIQLQFGFNSVYNHFRFTSMWELWNGKVKKGKDKSSNIYLFDNSTKHQ